MNYQNTTKMLFGFVLTGYIWKTRISMRLWFFYFAKPYSGHKLRTILVHVLHKHAENKAKLATLLASYTLLSICTQFPIFGYLVCCSTPNSLPPVPSWVLSRMNLTSTQNFSPLHSPSAEKLCMEVFTPPKIIVICSYLGINSQPNSIRFGRNNLPTDAH